MEVENIARICLASGRTAENQGYLAVCNGLFGEVVIDYERVASRVAEVFTDGRSGKRGVILKGRRVRCRGGNHYRVVHCTVFLESVHYSGNCGAFLAYRHIDAIDRFARFEVGPLLMMVSMAMAVLPVWRSPMMSSL